MFGGGLLLVVVSLTLLTVAKAGSLDDVAKMAVQKLHDNMGEDTLLLKDMLTLKANNHMEAKSRQKRIIELPRGMVWEIKWNIDVWFQSFVRWDTMWQFAALIAALYPAEILHDTKKPTLVDILPPDIADIVQDTFTGGDVVDRKDGGVKLDSVVLHRRKRASRVEREVVYSMVESLLETSGLPPRACLLRTICEVAEAPFEQELIGDLINTIFRPSKGCESSSGDDYDEFLLAERHGHHNGSCHLQYAQCPETIFDRIPFFRHQLFY